MKHIGKNYFLSNITKSVHSLVMNKAMSEEN